MSFDRKKPAGGRGSFQRGPSQSGGFKGGASKGGGFKSGGFKKRRRRSSGNGPEGSVEDGVRLQKVMASAGIGSRRHCEELIETGRVQIDGTTAKIGAKVDPAKQVIRVDGEVIKVRSEPVYYLVNKPEGVVSTNSDPSGRPRVIDLVPIDDREHLFTVGRLDLSSEGLILVTNDGELANQLTHPRYGVDKTYLALVAGQPDQSVYQKLRQGVRLAEGIARVVSVYVKRALPQSTLLEIVLDEGKNREIRRILAKVGHKVLKLKRSAIGDVGLHGLKPGEFRKPTREELKSLREATHKKKTPRVTTPVAESELVAKPRVVESESDVEQGAPTTSGGAAREPRKPYVKRPDAVRVTGIKPGEAYDVDRPRGKKKFEKKPFSAPARMSRGGDDGAGRRDRGARPEAAAGPGKKPFGAKKSFGDKKPYGEKKAFGENKSFGEKKPFGKKFAGGKPGKGRPPAGRSGDAAPTDADSHELSDAGFPGKKFARKSGAADKPRKFAFDEHMKKKGPPEKGIGTIIGD